MVPIDSSLELNVHTLVDPFPGSFNSAHSPGSIEFKRTTRCVGGSIDPFRASPAGQKNGAFIKLCVSGTGRTPQVIRRSLPFFQGPIDFPFSVNFSGELGTANVLICSLTCANSSREVKDGVDEHGRTVRGKVQQITFPPTRFLSHRVLLTEKLKGTPTEPCQAQNTWPNAIKTGAEPMHKRTQSLVSSRW